MRLDSAEDVGERVCEIGDTFLAHRHGMLAVIEVYLDESGTHHGSPAMSVAAVWAAKSDWANWTIDWVQSKAPIRIFHAVDCSNRDGEFKGWGKAKRDIFVIKRILPVISRHYIRGTAAAIDLKALAASLLSRHGLVMDPSENARGWYYICVQWAIRAAWEEIRSSDQKSQIAFVHEENQYAAAGYESFRQVKRHFPDDEATFSFGSKGGFPPLQCADLLAYEAYQQMRNSPKPLRPPLAAIDPSYRRFSFRKCDANEIDGIADFTANYLTRVASELASGPY